MTELTYRELHAEYYAESQLSPSVRAAIRRILRSIAKSKQPSGFFYNDRVEWERYKTTAFEYDARLSKDAIKSTARLDDRWYRDYNSFERENAQKFKSFWRDVPDGRDLPRTPLWRELDMPELIPRVRDFIILILDTALRAFTAQQKQFTPWSELKIRRGTHIGWPTHAPGSQDDEMARVVRFNTHDGLSLPKAVDALRKDAGGAAAGHVGNDPAMLRFTRIQESRKGGTAAYNDVGHELIRIVELPDSPKVRAVYAVGKSFNMYLLSVTHVVFELLHSLPFFPDTVADAYEYMQPAWEDGLIIIPEDIKAYDLNMPYELLRGVVEGIYAWCKQNNRIPSFGANDLTDVEYAMELMTTMPLIGPAMTSDVAIDALKINRKGCTPSGFQATSVVGSLGNITRACFNVAESRGISLEQAWKELLAKRWRFLCQSDDCLVAVPSHWTERLADVRSFGFEITTQGGPIYLQRMLDFPRESMTASVARMYVSLINKERQNEPNDEDVVCLGIHARMKLLEEHPWRHEFITLLMANQQTAHMYRRASSHSLHWWEERVGRKAMKLPSPDAASAYNEYNEFDASSVARLTREGIRLAELLSSRQYMKLADLAQTAEYATKSLESLAMSRLSNEERYGRT